MREVIRRILTAVCLYGGITLCLIQGGDLYRVEPVDWHHEVESKRQQSRQITGMMSAYLGSEAVEGVDLAENTRGTLEEFIADETEGRLIIVSGPDWEGLWNDVSATVSDNSPSSAWAACRGVEHCREFVYLKRSAGPLTQLADNWPIGSVQSYVRIDPVETSAQPHYLNVVQVSPSDLLRCAPLHIAYPYRTYGAATLIFGLLFYIGFPRRPRPEGTAMFYEARAAGWLPDLLAAFGSGMFFGLPFLIASDTGGSPLKLDWLPITVVMWGMAGLFASMFVITTWYQTRRVTWDEHGAWIETWGCQPTYVPANEIETVGSHMLQAPAWLRNLAWVITIFNWRAGSSAILLEQSDPGFAIATKQGQSFRFTGAGLYGARSFLAWLDTHHVPVDPSAREIMRTNSDYKPTRIGWIIAVIFAVLIVALVVPSLWRTAVEAMPHAEPEFRQSAFAVVQETSSPVAADPIDAKPVESQATALPPGILAVEPIVTPEMLAQEGAILQKMEQKREELKTLQSEIGTITNPNAEVIEKVQQIMREMEQLQAEFDDLRRGGLTTKGNQP
ncbi:hypothetical protein C5Y96_20410 [Blastopirellula marina]|uniref:Uncharacterized protein n=1 Tax=Blastopirellula marina TaxID=124 RepID=A0A2S8F2R5_9BACT|nr:MULTISPECIES: hypothetical protein [Pirellulaceae]PQO26397.1 hypothetical protein C5Y96_20410 [Blastopirellula marina]RCS44853.1 hypothetical protein DTL36_20440 [Bremerella cremea]